VVNAIQTISRLAVSNPKEFLRFIVVGGVNTLFGFSIYSMCIYLGVGYFFSSAAALGAGVVFNHRTIGKYVFNSGNRKSFFPFAGCYLIVFSLTVILLELLGVAGANPYVSGFVVSIPMAVLSYFLQRRYVFRTTNDFG
jgi:putative flippase GtrA